MIATLTLAVTAMLQLQSSDIKSGGTIPRAFMSSDCGGRNRTPALSWTVVPSGTKSFALVVHDPEAPIAGGFDHWVIYNIAGSTRQLSQGAVLTAKQIGLSSAGKPEYYGPCPPPGPAHHYVFTLYALDLDRIPADAPLSGSQLQQRIAGHVLARATFTALASH